MLIALFDIEVWANVLASRFSTGPRRGLQLRSSCAAPTISIAMRWSARFTMPCASWNASSSPRRWSWEEVPSKWLSPSTWITLLLHWYVASLCHNLLLLNNTFIKCLPYFVQSSREQLAIGEFAHSLLVIPKTLAVNAAKDATDLVAKMRSYHHSSQSKPEHAALKWIGLDLSEGVVRDNRQAGVFEPAISKIKSLKFATEAAITILRIDDMIKLESEDKNTQSYNNAYQCGQLDEWKSPVRARFLNHPPPPFLFVQSRLVRMIPHTLHTLKTKQKSFNTIGSWKSVHLR